MLPARSITALCLTRSVVSKNHRVTTEARMQPPRGLVVEEPVQCGSPCDARHALPDLPTECSGERKRRDRVPGLLVATGGWAGSEGGVSGAGDPRRRL